MDQSAIATERKSYRLVKWFGSAQAFWAILTGFVFSAVWIAVSGNFPMAFDEDYHLGIIKIYAHRLSPFFASQPPGTYQFGAFTRDPSYLYHYLMSFPWRLVTAITNNFMAQVITMRLLNIAIFAAALFVFRKILLRAKLTPTIVNFALLLFVLTPLTSQVAAQINYDSLLILCVGLGLLLTLNLVDKLRVKKTIDLVLLGGLTVFGLLASLSKYAFLPVAIALFGYLGWYGWWFWRDDPQQFRRSLKVGYQRLTTPIKLGLVVGLLVSGGLFFERYGLNTIRYGTPIPECNQVLTVAQCQQYSPWNRNYEFAITKNYTPNKNPLKFTAYWIGQMSYNLMFALNGAASNFLAGDPLLLPKLIMIAFSIVGGILSLIYFKSYLKNPVLRLCLIVTAMYLGALWLQNFHDYMQAGQPVAIQGRYLLPVLIPLYAIMTASFSRALTANYSLKFAAAMVTIVCLLAGGGVFTFILRSDNLWYWPNNKINSFNRHTRHILRPIIPGAKSNITTDS